MMVCGLLLLTACRQQKADIAEREESTEAKRLLQGIWMDEESETVVFKMEGDSVYYPDSTSLPAYFRVVDDTLVMGATATKYPIVKQSDHLFWFKSPNGDIIKLVKSSDEQDSTEFVQPRPSAMLMTDKVVKRDTVVSYDGTRYHCYIAVNPTRNKVTKSEMTADGVQVDNAYYDNIIHVSIFSGSTRLFAKNFAKQAFAKQVPVAFLHQAILDNMTFEKADERGFHFNATLCIPDEASCYMVETVVSKGGNYTMELMEY